MGKIEDFKRTLETMASTPLADILLDEGYMDAYRDYLTNEYSPSFAIDDEEDIDDVVEDMLDNFDEMMEAKGQILIKELFSDVFIDQVAEIIKRSKLFAEKMADSDQLFELFARENEFGEYYDFIYRYFKRLKLRCNPPQHKKKKRRK